MKQNKLSVLAFMYIIPVLVAILAPFKGIAINDEPISTVKAVLLGLFIGMCLEGFLLIAGFTFAVLMGKID